MSKKICFAASSGGHFEQLMRLRPVMEKYESSILTEKTVYALSSLEVNIYYLKQINRREIQFIPNLIINMFQSIKYFVNEKPDVIISTGALSTIPICILGKFFNKKIIFIESFAKVTSPTLTGKLMYKVADQFYVQWESMLEIYPNAIFKGGIY